MQNTNQFAVLWALGYRRLVPITPPGCEVSEKSSLFIRIQKGDDARGKAPGRKWGDGTWSGFDWLAHTTTEADLERWNDMGAGVGIRTGDGLVLIDADTKDVDRARIIRDTVIRHFGQLPIRIGNYPKAGYLVRTDVDFQYTRIEFGERDAKGRLQERVEILSEGRQFVAHGVHPATQQPYRWPQGLPALADVPTVTGDALLAFLEDLRPQLPAASEIVREGAKTDVDQKSLLAPLDLLTRAVKATPNSSEHFPTRESYLDFGYAIKAAAGPDHQDEAFELFADWCDRWAEGENEPEIVRADWGRMKGPFRRGASWLYEVAQQCSAGVFTVAERYWEPYVEAEAPLFPDDPADSAPNAFSIHATPLREFDPAMLPRRQWLYGDHYIRKYVSTTSAPSAVGKSSMVLVEALAMVTGKPLLGIQPKGVFRVWYWNGEDPIEEMELRLAAAMKHYGLAHSDLGGRFFLNSGREMPIVLAKSGRDGAVIHVPVVDAVMATMRANAIDVGVLDPFVSTYAGAETNEMLDPVVKKWGAIAGAANASIELVHHTRKLNGTEASVEDTRGGGALIAGARSKRVLARMTKPEAKKFGIAEESHRRFFRVADASVNMALPAIRETAWLEMHSVSVGNGEGDTPVEREMSGDSVGVAAFRSLQDAERPVDDDQHAAILAALASGEWRENARSNAWAGHAVATVLRVDASEEKSRIEEILRDMKRRGDVYVERRTDKNGNKVPFIVVTAADVLSVNLFD